MRRVINVDVFEVLRMKSSKESEQEDDTEFIGAMQKQVTPSRIEPKKDVEAVERRSQRKISCSYSYMYQISIEFPRDTEMYYTQQDFRTRGEMEHIYDTTIKLLML